MGGHPAERPARPLGEAPARGSRTARPGRPRLAGVGSADPRARRRPVGGERRCRGRARLDPWHRRAPADRDEWRHVGATSKDELIGLFAPTFFFGCEADDRTIAYTFSPANAHGFQLKPIFSSDIGHWDAGDIAGVVAESFELVEDEVLTEEQYRRFVYEKPGPPVPRSEPALLRGHPSGGPGRHHLVLDAIAARSAAIAPKLGGLRHREMQRRRACPLSAAFGRRAAGPAS